MHAALFLALQAARPADPYALPRSMIIMLGFLAVFYFLLLRPQRKLAQRHQEMLKNLQKNDEVMTEGGLIGTVVHIQDERVTLRTGENTRVVVMRAKIARILSGETAEPPKPQ
ncbi:MAG TPA: preprotein translocase subunit YajC [Longimicrobiales bacterium]